MNSGKWDFVLGRETSFIVFGDDRGKFGVWAIMAPQGVYFDCTTRPLGTESRLRPDHFIYPERSLIMEEMLNKFIDEGKQEHEEMRAFIYDFQTNNELLFKERNNSLIELKFRVQELLKVINNVLMIDCDVKGVTTRGGKTTTQDVHDNDTNVLPKEPVVVEPEKPVGSNEVLTNDQPQITSEPVVQPSNEVQPPPVPFPRRLRKEKDKAQQKKFLENLKQLHINLPFIEALAQMPKYAKFLKGLLTNKARLEEACKIIMNERCSAVLLNKIPSKEKDPGSFTIPCDIGQLHIDNALEDLGASISLMPYTMYKKLGLGEPKATSMSLELADRSIQYPRGIIENVLIKVDKFVLPIDFVILDMPEDLRTNQSKGQLLKMMNVMGLMIWMTQSMKKLRNCWQIKGLEKSIDQSNLECYESTSSDEKNGSDSENSIRRINSINTPYPVTQGTTNGNDVKSEHLYSASANEIDEKKPELKNLPQQLEYAYLNGDKSFPIIISSELFEKEKISLLRIVHRILPYTNCSGGSRKDYLHPSLWDFCLGAENLAADHLSRLENPYLGTFTEEEITDEFPDEHLMILKAELNNDEPWYADYVNYIVGKILCSDNVMRRCVAGNEILEILRHCHSGPTGGHHSASITERKVYESGFYWPSIFKDAKDYVMRTAYKTPTGCTPFKLVYGKACHLPVEIKHKAYWALKQCNMDLTAAAKNHFMKLNELMELRDEAYENTRIYKERTKRWHDSRHRGDKDFKAGDKVLLFNSRFKMHPGKLKSKWYGPNVVKTVHPYGTVEIIDKNRISFKVNGQRLKKYHNGYNNEEEKEVIELNDDTT
ncbi:reverse transcriptase domain-containing protein [Tanacetum coccineum]